MRARLRILGFVLGVFAGVVASRLEPGDAYASRNSGGTYTLPAGNPVVSGTTITSTWANNTLNDIGTELTNSLDRTGRGGMTGQLKLSNGSSSAPAATFSSELTSGLYRAGSNDLRMQVASTTREKWTSTGVEFPTEPVTFTGPPDAGPAIIATGASNASTPSDPDSDARGAAILATGGASYGPGLFARGAAGAPGVVAIGGSGGAGIYAAGGSGNSAGISAVGSGTQPAILANGAASGTAISASGTVSATVGNGATYAFSGVSNINGDIGLNVDVFASTLTTRQTAIRVADGDIAFASPVAPASTTSISNSLTAANIVKVWGTLNLAGPPTVLQGFNIASISCATNVITVNFASNFASSGGFAVVPTLTANDVRARVIHDYSGGNSASSVKFAAFDNAGSQINLCAAVTGYAGFTVAHIDFMIIGAQ